MRSIIFFDIDGTIVTEDERAIIPQSTMEAIALTREKGNLTFINSGRTAFNISPKVKKLGFDGYICGCGTYIEYGGKVLLSQTVEKDKCKRIAELMRKCWVTPVYEHRDGYFFDDKTPVTEGLKYFMEVFVDSGIDVSGRVEDNNFGFDKFVIWTNPDSDMELFRQEISKDFSIIDRGGGFYENVPLGFSKATGIAAILDKLGISIENAYAIGDSTNDLPMLQAVPNSIAMGGAEHIYPYVSYVTNPIEENGIYNALKHFELI
ncbi:HAD hydrolase family protein [Ruminococcus sp.]|uniref:HAD hydrolase family protein n=1 Tax=Ruminococcus sp. TaxID=41978 RepID=UPI001B693E52|nr:HAD hydrolase family protein [Ruminococcus sp.]MBP5433353.1 HAD hydrolase family protein [Ruminococcus sp.]